MKLHCNLFETVGNQIKPFFSSIHRVTSLSGLHRWFPSETNILCFELAPKCMYPGYQRFYVLNVDIYISPTNTKQYVSIWCHLSTHQIAGYIIFIMNCIYTFNKSITTVTMTMTLTWCHQGHNDDDTHLMSPRQTQQMRTLTLRD